MTSSVNQVSINIGQVSLDGNLTIPGGAKGVVLFAHGSGSSRMSPRNRYVAGVLNRAGLATLLFDLLTEEEERIDVLTAGLRFDIGLLAQRVIATIDWLTAYEATAGMSVGVFGASTGAAAALVAAAERPEQIHAVVSRGGRPDMAEGLLTRVKAPTLLIVGGNDYQVIKLNEQALAQLSTEKKMEIVPGATHLFEEPGTLEEVARIAAAWFQKYLAGS